MTLRSLAASAALTLALFAGSPAARAADAPATAAPTTTAPAATDRWEFQATLYAWATSLDGDVGVRQLPTVPVHASFTDLIGHLQGTLPVAFMAKKDGWTLLFDFFWTDLGTDTTLGTPAQALASATLKQTIASAVFGYRLPVGGPDFDLSATAGFRYQRLSLDTSIVALAAPYGFSETDVRDWLDPVFGLMLNYRFNDKWFLNALADVGGFGLGSKLTSQGFVAVGYNWTASWSTALGYRALYTDYQSITGPNANFRYNTTIHGPFMSLAYHF